MQRSKSAAALLAFASIILGNAATAVVVDDGTDTLHGAGCATTGTSPCSLRDAITFANTTANTTISFNLAGGGVHTIAPASALPAITNSTTIDGYTQPGTSQNTATILGGSNAVLLIELNLTNNAGGGLVVTGNNAKIQGLVINRSPGVGMTISGNNVQVAGNFIGTNPAGTAAGPGNAGDGVAVGGQNDLIGGNTDAVRNVISGNGGAGVRASGAGAVFAIIGSNLIGTNAAGTAAIPNGAQGVVIAGQDHVVGVLGSFGRANVISGNTSSGVLATASISSQVISGNNIGANAAQNAPLGNGGDGITVNTNFVDVSDNLIGGNAGNGISIAGNSNGVTGNNIGSMSGGTNPNLLAGISLQPFASDNAIGGFMGGNGIQSNVGNGIEVLGAGLTGGIHNAFSENIIGNNGGLGIKLGAGSTPLPNDAGDADTGPNELQNYPVITSAAIAGVMINITGTINSKPNDDLEIEIFANPTCDPSGNGEGTFLISPEGSPINVTTDASGNGSFSVSLPANPFAFFITATATNSALSTSEFSQCFLATGGLPTISINDVSQAEGNSGTTNFVFTVTISASANATVNFATANGTATAGSDYAAKSGTVTFTSGGPTTQTVTVQVNGDTTVEPDETFFVNLSGASGATILDGQGQGTIVNDDVAANPTITINDVSQNEGNSGTTNFVFTVTISQSANATVNFATANGTASAGTDYVANSGTVTFTAGGPLTQTITVAVNGNTVVESNKTFVVNLSGASGATISDNQGLGTIVNDDVVPTLSVSNASVIEGNSGIANLVFTVSISSAPTSNVTVNYATADGTAVAGTDYAATSGTLTFAPGGPLAQTVTVQVNGDTAIESNETLFLNLSGAVGAPIADAQGVGTIIDDDTPQVIPTLGAAQMVALIVLLGLAAGLTYRRTRRR